MSRNTAKFASEQAAESINEIHTTLSTDTRCSSKESFHTDSTARSLRSEERDLHSSAGQDVTQGQSQLFLPIQRRFSLASPFYRIPTEIWAVIFKIATIGSESDILSPSDPRSLIRNVCHIWRGILQSLPEIWSQICLDHFTVGAKARRDIPAFLAMRQQRLCHALRFSGDISLHITLDIGRCWPESGERELVEPSEALIHPSLLILAQHSSRWASFNMRTDSNSMVMAMGAVGSSFRDLDIEIFPLLKSISLNVEIGVYEVKGNILPFTKKGLPSLRNLRLSFPLARQLPELPWPQLDVVYLHQGSEERRVLPRLQSSSTIDLSQITWYLIETILDEEDPEPMFAPLPADNIQPFELPRLKKFTTVTWDSDFLAYITAPSLQELSVEVLVGNSTISSIAAFIGRSQCSITTLSCGPFWSKYLPDPEIFLSLLSSLPNLKSLQFFDSDIPTEMYDDEQYATEAIITAFLRPLGLAAGGQLLHCPLLQHLRISSSKYRYADYLIKVMTQLVDVIELRWRFGVPGVSGFRMVTGVPKWEDRFSPEKDLHRQYKRLETLEREGLRVVEDWYDCEDQFLAQIGT